MYFPGLVSANRGGGNNNNNTRLSALNERATGVCKVLSKNTIHTKVVERSCSRWDVVPSRPGRGKQQASGVGSCDQEQKGKHSSHRSRRVVFSFFRGASVAGKYPRSSESSPRGPTQSATVPSWDIWLALPFPSRGGRSSRWNGPTHRRRHFSTFHSSR